jgi:hypothetical protein
MSAAFELTLISCESSSTNINVSNGGLLTTKKNKFPHPVDIAAESEWFKEPFRPTVAGKDSLFDL